MNKDERKPSGYWTFERCKATALEYETLSAWRKCSQSSLQAAYRNGWIEICTTHMKDRGRRKTRWTLELCRNKALEFKTRSAWKKGHRSSYSAAQRLAILDQCTQHMDKVYEFSDTYWTLERCKKQALKYGTRTAWSKWHRTSYKAACENGWLEHCCGHMVSNTNEILDLAMSRPWR